MTSQIGGLKMKDKVITPGIVKEVELKDPINKGAFSLRKMFRDYLGSLFVPYVDKCCETAPNLLPIAYNVEDAKYYRFNPETNAYDIELQITEA